ASMVLYPIDPIKLPEFYDFVPSLRRSLRLSQAARCAPVFGTDLVNEDVNFGIPPNGNLFKIEYLGLKKTLVLMHANPEGFVKGCSNPKTPDPKYTYVSKQNDIMPMPRDQWEVRDQYVLELKRLPQLGPGYCYANRRLYVDKESLNVFIVDLWDSSNKL